MVTCYTIASTQVQNIARWLSLLSHLQKELANILPLVTLKLDNFTVFRMFNHSTITSKFLERDIHVLRHWMYIMILLRKSFLLFFFWILSQKLLAKYWCQARQRRDLVYTSFESKWSMFGNAYRLTKLLIVNSSKDRISHHEGETSQCSLQEWKTKA